ncbi:hypothetical protein B1992_03450 [Pseudoxanthomonas broegbernensis]|uniref:Anti-bacteriophage protein A/HamA C-terminal domain-containing protein n=1 Tax=Pseudoxanthomonas broegbernensis TaxID=83619 RepID=A0A7V8K8F7_9GAMM|nr:DUF1837 domain-containing protein [Pseudoxanthomonas broegbernensis]KAF1687720.1 hypothetical protein B1992_03450 [Pseudoxanthomonas broegbernensis]MBB6064754.1 hypothetical protein [Pseudoxanthomonas broegbernensis]
MLQLVLHELASDRSITGLCAGYEAKKWRHSALADYLMESLPDFCLTYSEYSEIGHESAVRMIRKAAKAVYSTGKFKNRGEFGELLLHVILKMTMNTLPAVSKIYYKDAANDTVKGFDAVHVVPSASGLELWLGEVKFYEDISAAIRDVTGELEQHLAADYLRSEFVAILNKVDEHWPHAQQLMALLDERTSLDQVFNAFCIPVLLTYDGKSTAEHESFSEEYKEALVAEMRNIKERFDTRTSAIPHRIHLFLVPLKTKKILVEELHAKLEAMKAL